MSDTILPAFESRRRVGFRGQRKYTDEFRAEAIAPILRHEITALARAQDLGIPHSVVSVWVARAAPPGWRSEAPRRELTVRVRRHDAGRRRPQNDARSEWDAMCPECNRPDGKLKLAEQLKRQHEPLVQLVFETDGNGLVYERCPQCGYRKKVAA